MNPSDQARQVGVVNSWQGQSRGAGGAANPGAAQVIYDTGALAGGYYDVFYMISCSVALAFDQLILSWRNAADNANLWLDYFVAAAAASQRGFFLGVQVATGERFKVMTVGSITGYVSGSIITVRRA